MRTQEASGGTPLAAIKTVALSFSNESMRLNWRRGDEQFPVSFLQPFYNPLT